MNSITKEWTGILGGVPDWESINVKDFPEAFETAMREYGDDFEAIVSNPEPATFQNTVLAASSISELVDRVFALWGVCVSNNSTPEIEAIDAEWSPRIAEFFGKISLDSRWAARIKYIKENEKFHDPHAERVIDLSYTSLQKNGAYADDQTRDRLVEIGAQLSGLFTRFSQNSLADEGKQIALAAGVAINNTRSAVQPVLQGDADPENRRIAWEAFTQRGADTNYPVVAEILNLRMERAKLLGYANHAEYRLDRTTMAGSEGPVMDLLLDMWEGAKTAYEGEIRDIEAAKKSDGFDGPVEPWDYLYYVERIRKERYDIDDGELRQYFKLDNMVDAILWIAEQNFGMIFEENTGDIPVFDPDVRTFVVKSASTDHAIGLFYLDNFARQGKRSGAWMTTYRNQSEYLGTKTFASNNNNFIKATEGPTLLSLDDAVTLFHEFGHALHYLSSDIVYGELGHVPRDFVELPSQLFERWLLTPEVLNRFARHHETDAPIPKGFVDKIIEADKFNKGFEKIEYLSCALVDMMVHMNTTRDFDADEVKRFVEECHGNLKKPAEIAMRHDIPHFSHLFSSDSYSAGYYSYIWADVMVADVWEYFLEGGRPFLYPIRDNTEGATMYVANSRIQDYYDLLLASGNVTDRGQAYRDLIGRDPDAGALKRAFGFE